MTEKPVKPDCCELDGRKCRVAYHEPCPHTGTDVCCYYCEQKSECEDCCNNIVEEGLNK